MSERCQATTESGEQCELPAQDGSEHCHVHGNDSDTPARMHDPEDVADAIRRADGNLSHASDLIGCHRSTIHDYCNEYPDCAEARDDSRASGVDDARQTIRDLMGHSDPSIQLRAAKFYAKHYDDTASERQQHEHTGEGGGPLEVVITDSIVEVDDAD